MKTLLFLLLLIPNICFSMITEIKDCHPSLYYNGYTKISYDADDGVIDKDFEPYWTYWEWPSRIYRSYYFQSDQIKSIHIYLHKKSIDLFITLYPNIHNEKELNGFYITEDRTFMFPLTKIRENVYKSTIKINTRYILKKYLSKPYTGYPGTLVAVRSGLEINQNEF